MGKNNRNNGAPSRKGNGVSSNEHFKVRYKNFTSEGEGRSAVSKMRRAGEVAVNTYGQMVGTELSEHFADHIRKSIFDSLWNNSKLPEEKGGKDDLKKSPSSFSPLTPKRTDPNAPKVRWEDLRLFASAIHSGDRGVIIAPKGVGKSALSMCIGAACASGVPTGLWPTYDEGYHSPQRVLYYDCELTDTDMYNRYERYGYEFPDNFERYDRTQFKDAYQILADLQWKVENQMSGGEEVTVFIDNITKMLKTEQVSEINWYNEKLDEIYNLAHNRGIVLTLITVVHVLTGEYKLGSPINVRDAAGGSNLTNYVNFILALEQPKTGGKTIIVKVLNSRGEPEPDNVCVLRRIGKDEGTYYHFEYVGEMPEKEALQGELTGEDESEPEQTKEEQFLEEARAIRAWLDEDSHRTQDDAAKHFGYKSRITICNRLKLLKNNGEM